VTKLIRLAQARGCRTVGRALAVVRPTRSGEITGIMGESLEPIAMVLRAGSADDRSGNDESEHPAAAGAELGPTLDG
jgi:hypothetical protein